MPDIEVAGLVTKISLDDTELDQSMGALSRKMNIVKSQFSAATAGLDKFGNSTAGLRIKSDSLSKQLQIQGTRVAKLQQEHSKLVTEKGKDATETQKMEVRLNKAAAEYNKLYGELQRTNKELAVQSSGWTTAGESLERAGDRLQKVGKGMETAGVSLTRNVTLPIVAAGGLALKAAIDYESAFAGVDELAPLYRKVQVKNRAKTVKAKVNYYGDWCYGKIKSIMCILWKCYRAVPQ